MNVGLLSTARINAKLVAGARAADGVEVVVAGSRSLERAEAHARELGIERAVGSYEAVLEDPEVDVVYIALPNADHVPWSIRALEAGKHVLCEKPMARSVEAVERAFDAADRAGRVLTEAFMWRHHPQTRRLVELLPEIGELRALDISFSFPQVAPGDLRLSRELEGGALMDVGCYCVSGARLVAGEPTEVAGFAVQTADGVDIRFSGVLRFAGDVVGHFDCGMDTAFRHRLEVAGSLGRLVLDHPWHGREPGITVVRADDSVERVEVQRADPYARELDDLAAAIRGERPPLLGREDAVGQARTIAALYESASSGRRVAP